MLSIVHRLRSDDALMLAYQRGDADAFEHLYHRHKDGLFAFLYRSHPNMAVVEEIAQDAWTAVIQAAAQYSAEGTFKTWLYQIGRNRLVDFWRRKDNQHEAIDDIPEPAAQPSGWQASEAEQNILRAIGELPLEQRDAVLLREQGFSLAEIGDITGAEQETVKSRLRYARKQLRERLVDEPGVHA
ncbi:MAG: sigma-70 family RNA polymerase sigma factor [Halioglobus sp.]